MCLGRSVPGGRCRGRRADCSFFFSESHSTVAPSLYICACPCKCPGRRSVRPRSRWLHLPYRAPRYPDSMSHLPLGLLSVQHALDDVSRGHILVWLGA
ncbi:hypothetical protein BDV18DRAFT_6750 [Aspergillus unguis]